MVLLQGIALGRGCAGMGILDSETSPSLPWDVFLHVELSASLLMFFCGDGPNSGDCKFVHFILIKLQNLSHKRKIHTIIFLLHTIAYIAILICAKLLSEIYTRKGRNDTCEHKYYNNKMYILTGELVG